MQGNEEKKDCGSSTEKPKGKKKQAAALLKTEPAAVVQVREEWPDARIKLLRDTIAKEASPEEFELALQVIKRTGLDPFARQIYFISRWVKDPNDNWKQKKVMTWQFSIDGFRLISQRTGKYQGMVGPFWCGKDGVWKDVWLDSEPPKAARVGILHKDFTEPLWGVAKFSSYVVTNADGIPGPMWKKMPEVMLAKCAESLARRAAFPQELSGLYTDDEMAQAGHGEPIVMPTDHRAATLAKDVSPKPAAPAGPPAANPAQAAAMEDDASRAADGLGKPPTGPKTDGSIDAEREALIMKTTSTWFKTDEGKELKSKLARLGYGTRTLMFEKFEKCEKDFENFTSVINDEFKKLQNSAEKKAG